jgi:hypothetical protein
VIRPPAKLETKPETAELAEAERIADNGAGSERRVIIIIIFTTVTIILVILPAPNRQRAAAVGALSGPGTEWHGLGAATGAAA